VDLINLNRAKEDEDEEDFVTFSFKCNGCDQKLLSDWVNGFKKKQDLNTMIQLNFNEQEILKPPSSILPYPEQVFREQPQQLQEICVCSQCRKFYCLECDIFVHETLLSCPTCDI
jgi:hypothetical protein